MNYCGSGSASIPVASNTEVASWIRGRSKTRVTPLHAIEAEGRPKSIFVADQLLVDPLDQEVLSELLGRHGAQIVPWPPVPRVPRGLDPVGSGHSGGMPLPVLLHVPNVPEPSSRGAEILRAAFGRDMSVTSESAARLLSLAAELTGSGRQVGLNMLSSQATLSLAAPVEANPADPLTSCAFTGKARIAAAWQLVEAFRQFRSTKRVTIGILDAGFWLNGFKPFVAPGQIASDLGSSVFQLNLLDENVGAGGASGINGAAKPWHGNGSASVATAKVGNGIGAAGVGGTVAEPVLFKTDGSLAYFFRCLDVCVGWGLDILNVSLTYDVESGAGEFFFPTSVWNRAFEFASNNGLIVVASAGNDNTRLPEDSYVRPATRTPGTITVGALDCNSQAQGYSNFGSSVDVWAPTDIPVIPNPNFLSGTIHSGTSASAPVVSGIMAMMRAVAPIGTLDAGKAKQLLLQTAWTGTGRVGKGVDAYAAVLAAMGGHLPDEQAESHATPETARTLKPGPGGALMPFVLRSDPKLAALSSVRRENWYRFTVPTFSKMDMQLRFYPLIGSVAAFLIPDDPDSRALPEVAMNTSQGFQQITGLLAPGAYKLSVTGPLNLYELSVLVTADSLAPDEFEKNDTFETATVFVLRENGAAPIFSLANGAGHYDLTLHKQDDQDYFRIRSVIANPLSVPVVRVSLSDALVDITLFDDKRAVIDKRTGVRSGKLNLPATGECFVRISGAQQTRYRLSLRLEVDPAHLPGPLQGQEVIPLPDLGDPPLQLDQGRSHILFQVDGTQTSRRSIALASVEGQPIQVDVLNGSGEVIATHVSVENELIESVDVNVQSLDPGTYILRIQQAGTREGQAAGALNVQIRPSFM